MNTVYNLKNKNKIIEIHLLMENKNKISETTLFILIIISIYALSHAAILITLFKLSKLIVKDYELSN